MKRVVSIILYYSIAYWLPSSYSILGGIGKKFRRLLCRNISSFVEKMLMLKGRLFLGVEKKSN